MLYSKVIHSSQQKIFRVYLYMIQNIFMKICIIKSSYNFPLIYNKCYIFRKALHKNIIISRRKIICQLRTSVLFSRRSDLRKSCYLLCKSSLVFFALCKTRFNMLFINISIPKVIRLQFILQMSKRNENLASRFDT